MQKRGQVTVFIVVGIVILIVFSFMFFLRGSFMEASFEDEMNALTVPKQLEPIKTYIDACLTQTILEGVSILGEQGGYITLPKDITPRSVTNPFSNTLEIYKGAEVAYWYFETANGIETQNIPTLESMETELEEYIDENFEDCFYNLDEFREQGFEIQEPTMAVSQVTINNNNIQVKLVSDTSVALKEVAKDIDKSMVIVNSKLGDLYELAKRVYEKEDETKFLEEKTIDMMVVYEEIPFSDTEFNCERKLWQKSEVVQDMKEIVNTNIAALRLKPVTSVSHLESNPEYFKIDVTKPNYVNERFQYFTSWPMQVDISPTRGDLLVGDPLTQSVPEISKFLNLFFCINNYHFVYDVKYPVLISLSDGNGFTFQFANMVKIDNNQPRTYESEIINYQDSTKFSDDFCENKVKLIETRVFDYESLEELSGASVLYKCFSTTCYIGETNTDGNLIEKFPPCLNGMVLAQKQGYELSSVPLSTNTDDSASILLDKHHTIPLEILTTNLDDGATGLLNEKQAVVQFENLDNGYITMVTQGDQEIKLTSGEYKITSYLLTEANQEIKIQTDSFVQCVEVPKPGVLGLFMKEEKCFETELQGDTLTDALAGGAVFEWNADLTNANKLTVYVPYDLVPRTQSEMLDVFNNIQTNHLNANFRYPEIE